MTARAAEYVETRVEAFDRLVRRSHALGVWCHIVLLGAVAAGGYVNAPEGGYVLHAALTVLRGFGGMFGDEDESLGLAVAADPTWPRGSFSLPGSRPPTEPDSPKNATGSGEGGATRP